MLDTDSYTKGSKPYWVVTLASDAVCLLVACLIALGVRGTFSAALYPAGRIAFNLALYVVASLVIYMFAGLYTSRRFKPFGFEVQRIIVCNLLMCVLSLAWFFLNHLDDVSRLMLVLILVFTTVLVILERWAWRKVMRWCHGKGMGIHRLLLIGGDRLAEEFYVQSVADGKCTEHGFSYLGYLAPEENPKIPGYLGGVDRLKGLLEGGKISEVVVTAEEEDSDTLGTVVALCGHFAAKVSIIPAYGKYLPLRSNIDIAGDLKMITLRSSPNANPGWNVAKRLIDILGSVVGLVLGSPFMLMAVIMVKTASPDGPVIFKQERSGRNGKPFTMYKFRTMVPNAEDLLEDLADKNEAEGPIFKIEKDPRIIKHGSFLRKTSIDEIPQFLNILQGSMSLVGPRPPLPKEVAKYKDWEWGRLSVKPGLTCYWQISGRSELSFDEWMKLDLKYVEDQSFATDMKILFKTVAVVFSSKGAW